MSTRANVIIKDSHDKLYFYRHSDGYPEGVKGSLNKFVELLKEGKIRNNVGQAAGWLIMIGAIEYKSVSPDTFKSTKDHDYTIELDLKDWKVGAYEPTMGLHGDIEHLYIIDLVKREWYEEGDRGEWFTI